MKLPQIYTTNLLAITNDFTDNSNKGKINNNICCSFEEFDILIKVFTGAISFCLMRSSHQRCSIKKAFLEISQNSEENTCARVSFFRVDFAKFLRADFFTEHLWWLDLFSYKRGHKTKLTLSKQTVTPFI